MPTLHWIGKDKVINHHRDVPYKVLEHGYGFTAEKGRTDGPTGSGNMIIHGDNLEALKALLPKYEGRVKCIYIDPPYNTGKEEWKYNDNVNDPRIKKWLHQVVGREGEDLSRHDKWLCMMYPRLTLLKLLLATEGVLFASIDSNEVATFKLLLEEVFGAGNWVGEIVWRNVTDNNPTNISIEHEYVLCIAKHKSSLNPVWKAPFLPVKDKLIELGEQLVKEHPDPEELQRTYTKWYRAHRNEMWPFQDYKFIDADGIYTGSRSVHNPGKEGYRYDVLHPVTKKPCQQPLMGYRFPPDTMDELLASHKILFGEDETKLIELKLYVKDYKTKLSSVIELDGRSGTNEVKAIFPHDKRPFDYPKPSEFIEELLGFGTVPGDIVLDTFAGSATTGHAVLNLNKQDGGNRQFILVEMMDYAESITAERVRRVIKGYGEGNNKVNGTGGGFDFYVLGPQLFDEHFNLNEDVGAERIREYVWYTETRSELPAAVKADTHYLLGKHEDTAYYFVYEKERLTVLDHDTLALLKTKAGHYVIYADNCILPQRFLEQNGITFKKIPRDITRF